MNMLEDLFTFPIVMVDADNETKKNKLGLTSGEELDIIIGEASLPYYDFVGCSDRWIPTEESLSRAINGKFDATYVIFSSAGPFLVPWSKAKFIRELKAFGDGRDSTKGKELKMIAISDLRNLVEEQKDKENEGDKGE